MIERIDERQKLKNKLAIDEDNLDPALVEQPGLYFSVADALALAIAERDEAKLTLEEIIANYDSQIRLDAARCEEKITETSLQRKITLIPAVQEAQQKYANKRLLADRWLALKESYKERSKMLQELVTSKVSQMYNLSIDRKANSVRRNYVDSQADHNQVDISRMRTEGRLSRESIGREKE